MRPVHTSVVVGRLLSFKRSNTDVIIITLCLSRLFSSIQSNGSHCAVNWLGTKTRYRSPRIVDNEDDACEWKNKSATKFTVSDTNTSEIMNAVNKYCRPIQTVTLLRHGIRYTSSKDMERGWSLIHRFQQCMRNREAVERLQAALIVLSAGKEKQLSATGAAEQREIGKRIRQKLLEPERNGNDQSKKNLDDILFLSSHAERAIDSCRAFQTGLFHSETLRGNISIRDDLLRFFEFCPRYQIDVKHNKSALLEYSTWREEIVGRITKDITERLEAFGSFTMSVDEMMSFFTVAATEYAISGTHFWLDIISTESVKLLEYAADLKNYYLLGYGYDINYAQSCPLISDIFSHMDRAVKGHLQRKRGVFYFGHAETVIPVMSLLGLFNDGAPLKADDFKTQANRKFRTSRISPFSSNVGFTLYDCDTEKLHRDRTTNERQTLGGVSEHLRETFSDFSERHLIMLEVNERPTKFPFSTEFLVPYEKVRKHYSQIVDRCRFGEICWVDR